MIFNLSWGRGVKKTQKVLKSFVNDPLQDMAGHENSQYIIGALSGHDGRHWPILPLLVKLYLKHCTFNSYEIQSFFLDEQVEKGESRNKTIRTVFKNIKGLYR